MVLSVIIPKMISFQKLRVMQRKLEEHEEALLGRTQVVDLLQKELTSAEQRNQVPSAVSTYCLPRAGSICKFSGSRYKKTYEP